MDNEVLIFLDTSTDNIPQLVQRSCQEVANASFFTGTIYKTAQWIGTFFAASFVLIFICCLIMCSSNSIFWAVFIWLSLYFCRRIQSLGTRKKLFLLEIMILSHKVSLNYQTYQRKYDLKKSRIWYVKLYLYCKKIYRSMDFLKLEQGEDNQ